MPTTASGTPVISETAIRAMFDHAKAMVDKAEAAQRKAEASQREAEAALRRTEAALGAEKYRACAPFCVKESVSVPKAKSKPVTK